MLRIYCSHSLISPPASLLLITSSWKGNPVVSEPRGQTRNATEWDLEMWDIREQWSMCPGKSSPTTGIQILIAKQHCPGQTGLRTARLQSVSPSVKALIICELQAAFPLGARRIRSSELFFISSSILIFAVHLSTCLCRTLDHHRGEI